MMIQESYEDPDVQLLMTLPGVDYTMPALKATLGDITRFAIPTRPRAIWAVPSVKQSAGKCYNGPITKAGSSQARAGS